MFAKLFAKTRRPRPDYDDDFFQETRMSFGDHLEELRTRMWRALKGLCLCLFIGFILDGIGDRAGLPWLGIGKPMLKVITEPVEEQVKQFYHERNERIRGEVATALVDDKRNKAVEVRTKVPVQPLLDTFDGLKLKNPEQTHIEFVELVPAADVSYGAQEGEYVTDSKKYLQGMGVMEAFMVYFKMSLLCGFILACPWIFYQMWAFIGAGLYPHEKRLINVYLPWSVGLFIGGCLLCQFLVMPRAVDAMLGFYKWIDVDPDLRLNEWLSFALLMPLVFGISFQTPLIMMFLNKIGVVTYQTHKATWRYAMFGLAVGTALLCPSTDVVSWLSLFIPTFGLYLIGVLICYMMPAASLLGPVEEEEAEVGV
jgi:Twin arginine targeting (Tat) protein translocase TatC